MRERPRCVVDTNVLISAGLTPHGTPRRIVEWVLEHGALLASKETLAEFATRFVQRPKFDRYASVGARVAFVSSIAASSEIVEVTTRVQACADPDDDKFLALAIDGRAGCVVTGNTKDFPETYRGVPVLTPARFAAEFVPT